MLFFNFNDLKMLMMTMILVVFMTLMGVAFITLLERKILSYIQIRKGPNKVSMIGFLQPFSDAIKLYTNEMVSVSSSNALFFILGPTLMLMIMMLIWITLPILNESFILLNEMLMIFCFMSLSTYPLMISGWSSYSNYSLIGSIRAISQMISYEVLMILLMLSIIIFNESYTLTDFILFQELNKYMYFYFPLFMIFFICSLAELNRSPFDLVEGESELISGFNLEYSSGLFGFIFMAEYGMIMFSSFLMTFFFLGYEMESIFLYFSFFFFSFFVIWIRGAAPRIRYDQLMMMCWKHFLLFVLISFYYSMMVKIFMQIYLYY